MTEYDALSLYQEFLDELFGTVTIAGHEYDTSYALEELDPIAFREGFLNYCDSEGIELE